MTDDRLSTEVTGLLQSMIRAQCVNDGTEHSGQESRNADILRDLFESAGLSTQTFTPVEGRDSIVTRIEGTDPSAPTLLLMGHTDVVPVSADGWSRDPSAADLVDGWIWGRGAVDMLNITASMALATLRLATSSWKPKGTLIFLGVADEEAGGTWGADWLLKNHPDAVMADYVLTESGGIPFVAPGGPRVWSVVGEKGVAWRRITVHGTPAHGSRPLHTDNALVTAAEIVRRLADYKPRAVISEEWRAFVASMGFDTDLADALTNPDRIWEGISELPPGLDAQAHACTHVTCAPTVANGGTKVNVIPDKVVLEIDIRHLPGQTHEDVSAFLADALGELYERIEVDSIQSVDASASPTDNPLWEAMKHASARAYPDAELVPALITGGTDARFFREHGIPSYGFGMFSRQMSLELWSSMFHGHNERVDQESLVLSVQTWEAIARELLGE